MAKKKKTQLKPVARGFATTSLPKKIIPTLEVFPDNPDLLESLKPDASNPATEENGTASPAVAANEDSNHNNVEEQYIQSLLDKFQDKTDKEVLRYLVLLV